MRAVWVAVLLCLLVGLPLSAAVAQTTPTPTPTPTGTPAPFLTPTPHHRYWRDTPTPIPLQVNATLAANFSALSVNKFSDGVISMYHTLNFPISQNPRIGIADLLSFFVLALATLSIALSISRRVQGD